MDLRGHFELYMAVTFDYNISLEQLEVLNNDSVS